MNPDMMRYRVLAGLLCAAALSSCDKNAVQEHHGLDSRGAYQVLQLRRECTGSEFLRRQHEDDGDHLRHGRGIDDGSDVRRTLGPADCTATVAPGQYTFSGKISATTDKDLAISSVQTTIEAGKNYSFYQSGFYNSTTKTVEAFIVEDPFPAAIRLRRRPRPIRQRDLELAADDTVCARGNDRA